MKVFYVGQILFLAFLLSACAPRSKPEPRAVLSPPQKAGKPANGLNVPGNPSKIATGTPPHSDNPGDAGGTGDGGNSSDPYSDEDLYNAWSATVGLLLPPQKTQGGVETARWASGSILRITPVNEKTARLDILTAWHTINEIKVLGGPDAPAKTVVFDNMNYEAVSNKLLDLDTLATGFKLEKADPSHDLALVSVQIPVDEVDGLNTIKMNHCIPMNLNDNVIIEGFPTHAPPTGSTAKSLPPHHLYVRKDQSNGSFTIIQARPTLISADGLLGATGGPVLSSGGQLIGVFVGSLDNSNRYDALRTIADCGALRDFIKDAPPR